MELTLKNNEKISLGEKVLVTWAGLHDDDGETDVGTVVGAFINDFDQLCFMIKIDGKTHSVPYFQVTKFK